MTLFLEVLDGSATGQRLPLRNGLTIGRHNADLRLSDSKVSSQHAMIQQRPDGSFWLVDLDSSNGIKTTNGRVAELELVAGQRFRLGRIWLIVGQAAPPERVSVESERATSRDAQAETGAPSALGSWFEEVRAVARTLGQDLGAGTVSPRAIYAFEPIVKLKFTQGPQSGTLWTLGYGPREAGGASLDLTLLEPAIANTCFRLSQNKRGLIIWVSPSAQGALLLNGKAIESSILRNGDVIEIGRTRIEALLKTKLD